MKKQLTWLSAVVLCCTTALFTACTTSKTVSTTPSAKQKSIVILSENDTHCGIDGYIKIAGLRDAINNSDTAYAAAVCSGDFLQGNTTGAISKGQYIIDIMKKVGYHAVTLGNHEFDFGVPRMKELLGKINAPVVCANFFDAGTQNSYYPAYTIQRYGSKKVAFVGATTPETMILEGYSFYDTNGIKLYDLKQEEFYTLIQQAVDNARREGADYVVLLAHVGETPQTMGFSSHRLVEATTGIDVVLDGHSHSIIPGDQVRNKEGKVITVTQAGTQLANVGKLLITPDGRFYTSLIPATDIPYKNEIIAATVDSVRKEMKAITSVEVANTDFALPATDEKGDWLVRNQETILGDLVSDAYRHALKTDIGIENGGGLRNGINAGTITYGDIIGVLPYDNMLRRIVATGQQIQEMLTACTAIVPEDDGNFPQCSGLRFTIHTKSRTVTDVQVLQDDGTYQPLDLKKTYTIALTDYNHVGGGLYSKLAKCSVLFESDLRYYEALADYLRDVLNKKVSPSYAKLQGRITIIND